MKFVRVLFSVLVAVLFVGAVTHIVSSSSEADQGGSAHESPNV
jgi:hypothetical protein